MQFILQRDHQCNIKGKCLRYIYVIYIRYSWKKKKRFDNWPATTNLFLVKLIINLLLLLTDSELIRHNEEQRHHVETRDVAF